MTQQTLREIRALADKVLPDYAIGVHEHPDEPADLYLVDYPRTAGSDAIGEIDDEELAHLVAKLLNNARELCDLAADGAAYRARCALATEVAEDSAWRQCDMASDDPIVKFTEWLSQLDYSGREAAWSRVREACCYACGGPIPCYCPPEYDL